MNNIIYIDNSNFKTLHFLENEEIIKYLPDFKQGWSFSNIYNIDKLKDVYLLIEKQQGLNYNQYVELANKFIEHNSEWNIRNLEEYINALRNYNVINDNNEVINPLIINSHLNEPLSSEDKDVFRFIFFSYIRFKEIINWFIDGEIDYTTQIDEINIKRDSNILYYTNSGIKYFNYYFYDFIASPQIYKIDSGNPKTNEAMWRFWDVFIKWGKSLDLIEKFNLDILNVKTDKKKNISCCYFINEVIPEINILTFIKANFKTKYIYIPEIIVKLALSYRITINKSKEIFIQKYLEDKSAISLDRTSEIFITKKIIDEDDIIFHPLYKGSYISHLTLLK